MSPSEILAAHLAYDPLFLVDEAANYLKTHPESVRQLARDGKISYVQATQGGRFKFRLSALNAYAESLEVKPRRSADREIDWGL